jgi:hypothetical protein
VDNIIIQGANMNEFGAKPEEVTGIDQEAKMALDTLLEFAEDPEITMEGLEGAIKVYHERCQKAAYLELLKTKAGEKFNESINGALDGIIEYLGDLVDNLPTPELKELWEGKFNELLG